MSSEVAWTQERGAPPRRAIGKLGAGSAVLLSLVALGVGCDSQASVIDQICCGLESCTGATVRDCRKRIEDGLMDHRLSRTGVARCADCVANNLKLANACTPDRRGCPALLEGRDCDHACGELDVALNARTTYRGRDRACRTVVASCRSEKASYDECGLEALLRKDATRAVDIEIETCVQCLNEVACPSDPARTATNGCDDHTTGLDLPFCGTLIDRCTTACSKLGPVASELALASAALTVCRRGVETCVRDEREEAHSGFGEVRRQQVEVVPFLGGLSPVERDGFGGAGGESGRPKSAALMQSGEAGAGGNGGMGGQGGGGGDAETVVPELDDCYEPLRQLGLPESEKDAQRAVLIEGCAVCLEAAPLCDDLYQNCAECRALYPASEETTQGGLEP
jgi:hypothetical protein